mmetsp:Transcript_12752/g.25871  ORF Transcript_12752/g.25871 Transcript_12752/m.25871 type:complete len:624 (-) Transcript_12752:1539-3410(-)
MRSKGGMKGGAKKEKSFVDWATVVPDVDEGVERALRGRGFEYPTPVQVACVGRILGGEDVVVQAETGSGKTLAFLVPILQRIRRGGDRWDGVEGRNGRVSRIRALVVEPTRELAVQVFDEAAALLDAATSRGQVNTRLRAEVSLLIGGGSEDMRCQGESPPVVEVSLMVATPGRLEAAIRAGQVNLTGLQMLILDEADRLLDMGFEASLNYVLASLPKKRQTALFSATQTGRLTDLVRAGLRLPIRVTITRETTATSKSESQTRSVTTPESLTCFYAIREQEDKLPQLVSLLAKGPLHQQKVIVFVLTCASVEFLSLLPWGDILAAVIPGAARDMFFMHGRQSQKRRTKSLDSFRASTTGVLFCTDVAARGLDFTDVSWIVQFDVPQDPDIFIHRAGRTARLGRKGSCVLFLAQSEEDYVEFLRVRKVPITQMMETPDPVSCLPREVIGEHVRKAQLSDRLLIVTAEKAFLSYLRGYKQHRCSFLLQFAKLNLLSVASSFYLLRVPRFAEFSKFRSRLKDFKPHTPVEMSSIPFKSKELERQRQEAIKSRKTQGNFRNANNTARAPARQPAAIGSRMKRRLADRSEELNSTELAELAEDFRRLKRSKRAKSAMEIFSDSEEDD